ncbi:MAG: DUF819 family protein [Acidobacteria bacterium]|nr:DUF819 family protein [Acidobacteriota bacterium]
MNHDPLIQNDAIVLGILACILAGVFITAHSEHPFWKKFYTYVPSLLLCYFLPSVLTSLGVYSGEVSKLYFVSSRYLLPACLVLLTLSIDLPGIMRLGPKALIMFFTGTVGIVIGGPLAILIFSFVSPETVGGAGPDAVWRGMTTIAGSWIGGGANQTAMKEVFEVGDQVFSAMIAVDVIVANIWMAVLLYMAGRSKEIDQRVGADTSAIESLRKNVEAFQEKSARIASLTDLMKIAAVGFGMTGLAHLLADWIAPFIKRTAPGLDGFGLTSTFFWIVVIATTAGILLSFTKARNLEGAGASKVGSAFLYILVASIGMKMDITAVAESPGLFLVGMVWIGFHATLLLIVAKIIKAPVFFMAVGSQANVGGAASAPIVASAFHPALAPVGVLLAVLGYALGTYGALICGWLMGWAAPVT